MKQYLLLGVIALVMLLAAPAMAAGTATIGATGSVVQTLSIESNINTLAFSTFQLGDNMKNPAGTLTITSAFVPNGWKVNAAMTDGYGFMRRSDNAFLTHQLLQYNYLGSQTWEPVQGLTFGGTSSTTMLEAFNQIGADTDAVGDYSTTITYTITPN
jgi:hypothetical protein